MARLQQANDDGAGSMAAEAEMAPRWRLAARVCGIALSTRNVRSGRVYVRQGLSLLLATTS